MCLDSASLDYKSIWLTSTLRGLCGFDMKVEIAKQGSHSGLAGGILPDTWRIITLLLSRLEDPKTGKVIDDLHVDINNFFLEESKAVAEVAGNSLYDYQVLEGVKPI